jgi:UDP-N-acetylmuramyl pentapeptide synthase
VVGLAASGAVGIVCGAVGAVAVIVGMAVGVAVGGSVAVVGEEEEDDDEQVLQPANDASITLVPHWGGLRPQSVTASAAKKSLAVEAQVARPKAQPKKPKTSKRLKQQQRVTFLQN